MSIFEATRNIVPQKDFSYIDIDAIDNKRHIIKSGKPTKKEKAPSRARRLLEPGDVLFSLVRPYLENIALVENQYANAIASTGFYVVRSSVLFPGFAYILFLSPYVLQGLNAFMKGDNSPSIRSENIEDFLYPIPPLSEQQEIVKAFNEVEYKLDTLQQSRQHYKRILSETPTSLRQQLVQSAIQGQLVPQNPNDEPASVLLERVAQERALKLGKKAAKSMSRIVRRGSKTYELFPDGSEKDISDEIPFDIPRSWEWSRLGTITIKLTDGSHNPPPKKTEGYRVISAQNIRHGKIEFFEHDRFTDQLGFEKENLRTDIKFGDVILGIIGGSIGNTAIYDKEDKVIAQRSIAIIRAGIPSQFLLVLLRSPLFQLCFQQASSGSAQGGIYLGALSQLLVPLPPESEQLRIVKKLDKVLSFS